MKRIIVIFLGIISVAYGQYSPTGSKTRFVNGISLGTKLDGSFNAADSNAIYWRADSVLRAKYKGNARTLAFLNNLRDSLIWGNITGSLNNQTDLRDTLATKVRYSDTSSMLRQYNPVSINNRLSYLDQFYEAFYGRGMLTAEAINIITQQSITSSYSAGANVIRVADTSKFIVGGNVTIKHSNGLYYPYFISQKSGDGIGGTIAIKPSLLYSVTTSDSLERTWFNRAHPGKYYMRYLAQRIANADEINSSVPTVSRTLFTNFSDTPAVVKDTLTAIGGAVINYFPASNSGIDTASPPRFPLGNTAYVEIASNGDGAETELFYIDRPAQMIASVYMFLSNNKNAYSIRIVNDSNRVIATYKIPTSDSTVKSVPYVFKFPFSTFYSNSIKVRILADTVTTSAAISISQIDVYEQTDFYKKMISKTKGTIVVLGDSWASGDTINTPERESFVTQLQIELPQATIINAGVGGNTIRDMLARFDTDVAPYNPDYVILETGTNDAYNPLSGVFYPTGVDDWINEYNQLIHKVLNIGAKPIVIGVPALAQSDEDVPAYGNWLLNNRARLYVQSFYKLLSKQTNPGGDYTFKLNVSDTAALTGGISWDRTLAVNSVTGRTFTAGGANFNGEVNMNTSTINSSSNVVVNASGRGASSQDLIRGINTGADVLLTIEGSSGGGRFSGSSAYASVIGTNTNTSFQIGTNNTVGYTMDGSRNNAWVGNGLFDGTIRTTRRTFTQSLNLNKDSVATSSAGSVLPLGIDTATGNVVKGSFGSTTATFTPTVVDSVNANTITPDGFTYIKSDNFVDVYGRITVTTTSLSSQFDLSLPISSNFSNVNDAIGIGSAASSGFNSIVSAVAATDAARISIASASSGTYIININYRYKIL